MQKITYFKKIRSFLFFILTFLVLGTKIHCSENLGFRIPFGRSYNYEDILVKRVIDGDTLLLENGERVRLIGIDTPEMHESAKLSRDARKSGKDIKAIQELGKLAYEFTKKLVENKRVRLEFDVQRYDKYGRLLAYVFLKEDNTFVNAKIIEEGYASLLTIPPNLKYVELFRQLYRKAFEEKRGLWQLP